MKTIMPDITIDTMFVAVILVELSNIKATMKTHSKTMNPICIGVSFFRAIKYLYV